MSEAFVDDEQNPDIAPDESEIRQAVREAMEMDGISQNRVSTGLGVPVARFSQWLNGKYGGRRRPVTEAARRWLDQRKASAELASSLPMAPAWFETPSSAAILAALGFAQMAPAIALIYGGAGVGKTTSIRRYQKQAPNVWVVTATPPTSRPGPILTRICQALSVRPASAVAAMEMSIYERVRDTRGLLVIDEAQHLCHRSLDCIRQIHDETGIGLALSGNELVYAQMTGGSRDAVYAQVFSRIAKRVRVSRPKAEDIDTLLDKWGIRDAATRKYCMEIGRRPGALRGLTHALRLARMYATEQSDKPAAIELDHVRAAWAELGGDA